MFTHNALSVLYREYGAALAKEESRQVEAQEQERMKSCHWLALGYWI
jgi:hypothetical protein